MYAWQHDFNASHYMRIVGCTWGITVVVYQSNVWFFLIPGRKENDSLFVFPHWGWIEMWFVLVGTRGFFISVMESGQSFTAIIRPGEMVTPLVYLELQGRFWVRAGNGAQAKGLYRYCFLRLERGKFAYAPLCWVLAWKLTAPLHQTGQGRSREKAFYLCVPLKWLSFIPWINWKSVHRSLFFLYSRERRTEISRMSP